MYYSRQYRFATSVPATLIPPQIGPSDRDVSRALSNVHSRLYYSRQYRFATSVPATLIPPQIGPSDRDVSRARSVFCTVVDNAFRVGYYPTVSPMNSLTYIWRLKLQSPDSERHQFQWPWVISKPDFKVTILFNVK